MKQIIQSAFTGLAILMTFVMLYAFEVHAVTSVPRFINYQGRLLNASGSVVTTPVDFRFSIWSDADFVAGTDLSASGTILPTAPDYTGWSEEQSVTPNADGLFNIQIGEVTPLPDLDFSEAKFLQIDIKDDGAADLDYELLDPDTSDAADDRKPLSSSPYSINADFLDNREIGTGSGDIVILDSNGQFDVDYIPDGTNEGLFVIDSDDSEASEVILQFGTTLAKTLRFDVDSGWFAFNDDLRIEGDLTLTGDIETPTGSLIVSDLTASGNIVLGSSSGNTITINGKLASDIDLDGNKLLNFVLHQGTGFPANPLPGQKFYRTDQKKEYLYNGTVWITTTTGSNERTMSLSPEYPNFTVFTDGSDNTGTLVSDYEEGAGTAKRNFYKWTSEKLSLQDIDLIIKFQLPSDFVDWQAVPLKIDYKTSDGVAANNVLDVSLFDTTGTAVTLSGGSSLVDASWTTADVTFSGSPTFTANDYIVLKIKMSSLVGKYAQIADIKLQYTVN